MTRQHNCYRHNDSTQQTNYKKGMIYDSGSPLNNARPWKIHPSPSPIPLSLSSLLQGCPVNLKRGNLARQRGWILRGWSKFPGGTRKCQPRDTETKQQRKRIFGLLNPCLRSQLGVNSSTRDVCTCGNRAECPVQPIISFLTWTNNSDQGRQRGLKRVCMVKW